MSLRFRTSSRLCAASTLALLAFVGCDDAGVATAPIDADVSDGAFDPLDVSEAFDASAPPDAGTDTVADAIIDVAPQPLDGAPIEPDVAPIDAAAPVPDAILDAPPEPVDAAVPEPATAAGCFDGLFDGELTSGPDYDQYGPIVGSHCAGTDHQRIEGIERVVFVGDSVTVGTPPNDPAVYFRNRLADRLADRFGLTPPDGLWRNVDLINGRGLVQESGDFANCGRYGARTDDLLRDGDLMSACVPPDRRHLRTLFVMTIGGNDVSSITQDGIEGVPAEELWAETEEFVGLLRDAMRWVRAPDRFPNGVFVVFANMFEFTDGTGDVTACPAAGLAGFGAEWDDPTLLADMVVWANEQYMSIAVEYGVDMIFMLEAFCGHGFNFDDPTAPCYRGPDAELWFDLTCIHPNDPGHAAITDLFEAVVAE